MPSNRYPLIANETWPALFAMLIIALAAQFTIGPIAFLVFVFFILIALFLFRDPNRAIPSSPLAVVSPVHGIVTIVEEAEEIRLKNKTIRIQIKMRPFDIYSLRSPIEGKIINQWCSSPCSQEPRRHFDCYIKSDEGDNIVFAVRLPRFFKWFHIYLHSGERIGQGQRCGYLYFGSVIDIFLPIESKVNVSVGDYVSSGSTSLARLIHSEAVSVINN